TPFKSFAVRSDFLILPPKINLGFNVETVEYKNISFTVWDVGGQVRRLFLPFSKPRPNPPSLLYPPNRTKSGLFGDTTIRTLRDLYLW
ncbi:hypothetical protein B484DRAFT_484481, partial [Ochromonadaceae sp. CCMP2298]